MATSGATVRAATHGDRPGILAVVWDAFTDADRLAKEEIDIVTTTWQLDAVEPGLELVAVEDEAVVGYVLTARGALDGTTVIGIAPLAVARARHGEGIGSALMRAVLARADDAGWPFAVLLGDPAFYGRFGFEPASGHGINYLAVGAGNPHFMVRRLRADDPSLHGNYTYCWERP